MQVYIHKIIPRKRRPITQLYHQFTCSNLPPSQTLSCKWKVSREIYEKVVSLETVETVAYFIFLGSKITLDGDCSHDIKRHLPLERKAMTNLDSVFKSRDIILPTEVHIVKAMVFPVVMYRCENWTIKKAEHWRTDAFELWCWRRLFLRVLWMARRSNQSIRKEFNSEYSLEGLMLKL